MKTGKRLIEVRDKHFRLDKDDAWVRFKGDPEPAIERFMIHCSIAVSAISINPVDTLGESTLLEAIYVVPKISDEAVNEILKRRERGDRLEAIGLVYGVSRQRIHQICENNGVTYVPPPDRIYPKEEEAICAVCEGKFIRKGKQVPAEKKTCSIPCENKLISKSLKGE